MASHTVEGHARHSQKCVCGPAGESEAYNTKCNAKPLMVKCLQSICKPPQYTPALRFRLLKISVLKSKLRSFFSECFSWSPHFAAHRQTSTMSLWWAVGFGRGKRKERSWCISSGLTLFDGTGHFSWQHACWRPWTFFFLCVFVYVVSLNTPSHTHTVREVLVSWW